MNMLGRSLRKGDGQGGSQSVQGVVIVPLFLLLVFLAIQVGMYWHANNVAHAAASAAYNEARLEGAGRTAGEGAAQQVLSRSDNAIKGASVSVVRTPNEVRATVRGKGLTVVPFWEGPAISQEVSGPTERWIFK